MTSDQRRIDVLNSLDGMQRARMPESLRERLLKNLPGAGVRSIVLSLAAVRMIAAGVALLAVLNVVAVIAHRERTDKVGDNTNPVAAEYFAPPPSI